MNMPDNLKIRQPQDPTKVNIHEAWEVEYWCKKWNITPEKLKEAVKTVGTSVEKVKTYLGK